MLGPLMHTASFLVTRNELDLADRLHSFGRTAIDFSDYTIPDDVDVRAAERSGCAAGLQNMHPDRKGVIAAREDARNARPARSG